MNGLSVGNWFYFDQPLTSRFIAALVLMHSVFVSQKKSSRVSLLGGSCLSAACLAEVALIFIDFTFTAAVTEDKLIGAELYHTLPEFFQPEPQSSRSSKHFLQPTKWLYDLNLYFASTYLLVIAQTSSMECMCMYPLLYTFAFHVQVCGTRLMQVWYNADRGRGWCSQIKTARTYGVLMVVQSICMLAFPSYCM